ncbi:hypothetical protein [Pseudoalteromonas sp. PA2MD11]|uniref:hypothetical protein n=1 Tax=Pseudoalteromonas sp. PA2MD11 TaxID=2785057 RepID=UPI001AE04F11|nr:hypothetical protein [Pseudoalteromonas sp. PA2MD11]
MTLEFNKKLNLKNIQNHLILLLLGLVGFSIAILMPSKEALEVKRIIVIVSFPLTSLFFVVYLFRFLSWPNTIVVQKSSLKIDNNIISLENVSELYVSKCGDFFSLYIVDKKSKKDFKETYVTEADIEALRQCEKFEEVADNVFLLKIT